MQTSRPIDVNGRFVGVAVSDIARWRFHATDPALNRLESRVFDHLSDVAREVQVATLQLPAWDLDDSLRR